MNLLKKLIPFCFFILFCVNMWAQCPQGAVALQTQADVNEFAMLYPNCIQFTDLQIGTNFGASGSSDITDLSPLNQITSIEGILVIRGNDSLMNLSGLENIVSIGSTLVIISNNNLSNLSGLKNLSSVGEDLVIGYNPSLIDLKGLENLTSIGTSLQIGYNENLSSLGGLKNINKNLITHLSITNNPALYICDIPFICHHLESGGSADIHNNAFACNNRQEITDRCSSPSECPQGDIYLETQAQVDSFLTFHPYCTQINSDLYIGVLSTSADTSSNITNLNALNPITSIERLFILKNNNLMSLTSLNNLTSVSDIIISNNDNLTNLKGLENLTSIDYLSIDSNHKLISLRGLDSLIVVGALELRYNIALQSLSGLDGLVSAKSLHMFSNINVKSLNSLSNLSTLENLWFNNNDKLTNLIGLGGLTSLEYLNFDGNDGLTDMDGLNGLNTLGEVYIHENTNLTSLQGLESLTLIEGNLSITYNDNLMALSGIDNATSTGENLGIFNNSSLSICNLPLICDYLKNDKGYIYIHDNAPNCNSTEEILALCLVPTTTPDYQFQIIISPNPTKGIFTLQGISKGTYQILNTLGQIIQQGDMKNDLSIDISTEVQGVYFISVTIDNETSVKRIIKI